MWTHHYGVMQEVVRRKISDYVKGRKKSNVKNTNKKLEVKISKEEETKIPKCSRNIHVETVNE